MPKSATLSEYDMEADWSLLFTCNYRCTYCFLPAEDLGSKLERHATPEQWREAFGATEKTWLIHMTGGEPTIYPGFVELCEQLTQRHVISFNSNLSRNQVRKLSGRVDPLRVSFVNAGFHDVERRRRGDIDNFLGNARFLQDAGFRVIVTAVATADIIARLPDLEALCAAHGLYLVTKVLRTFYEGKHYPREYAPHEKDRLREATARARDYYDTKYAGWPRPSIDIFADDELLPGEPDFRGHACSAGQRFVNISPNGDVHRCSMDRPRIGNLLQKDVRFAAAPAPCDTRYCPYFCKKYTAEALKYRHPLGHQSQTEIYRGISF